MHELFVIDQNTTDTARSASYLDLHLNINSGSRLSTKHYHERNDFSYHIVNFPFICSNISAAPACGELSIDKIFHSS